MGFEPHQFLLWVGVMLLTAAGDEVVAGDSRRVEVLKLLLEPRLTCHSG